VFTARYGLYLCVLCDSEQTAIISLYSINWLVCITETEWVYWAVRTVFMCFVWISEQTAIISLYNINWLVCITETVRVYCAVRTVFMCFVWISEQTAIISLYTINWLVCITEAEFVYCAVRTKSLTAIQVNLPFKRLMKTLLTMFLSTTRILISTSKDKWTDFQPKNKQNMLSGYSPFQIDIKVDMCNRNLILVTFLKQSTRQGN
jgi:hypothetical protein